MSKKTYLLAAVAALIASPALAHDCKSRVAEFELLFDEVAEEAISASTGGQAVAGAREAQAASADVPTEPYQEAAVDPEETDVNAGAESDRIPRLRAVLDQARDATDDAACDAAVDDLLRQMMRG